jgi:hypothetical protein
MKEKEDRKSLRFKRLRSFAVPPALVLALAFLQPVFAGDYPPRVSHVDGSAAYEPAGEVDWNEVTINLPLLSGDRIFSHVGSRVEIDLGDANFVRLGQETDLVFLEVGRRELGLELRSGHLILRVGRGERFRILTPIGPVSIRHKGLYRISVDPGGTTEVAVRGGRAEVESARGRQRLNAGDRLIVETSRPEAYYVTTGYYPDDLDHWSDRRDARFVSSRSVAYVGGTYYPGVWDLDYYGSWAYYPAYGRVWVPRVSVGWVPYRVGRWAHFSWGWTWISYEPWGWLPYHYGHWVHFGGRWGWVPGGFHRWSPAVVNFYFGSGFVGWAPRGPRGGTTIIDNRVIINNNTTIINEATRRGMTVVRQDEFGRARSGGPANFVSPSRQVAERLRVGLPAELRDSATIRSRGAAAAATSARTSVTETPARNLGENPRVGRTIDGSPTARPRIVDVPARGQASPAAPGDRTDSGAVRTRTTPPQAGGEARGAERSTGSPNVITLPRTGRTIDAPPTARSPRVVERDTPPPPSQAPESRSIAPPRSPTPSRSVQPRDTRPEVRSAPPPSPTPSGSVQRGTARPDTRVIRPGSSAPSRAVAPSESRSVRQSSPAISRPASNPRPQVQRAPSAPSRPAPASRPARRPNQ